MGYTTDFISEADEESDKETREWEIAQAKRAGGYDDGSNGKPAKKLYVPTPSKSLFTTLSSPSTK